MSVRHSSTLTYWTLLQSLVMAFQIIERTCGRFVVVDSFCFVSKKLLSRTSACYKMAILLALEQNHEHPVLLISVSDCRD